MRKTSDSTQRSERGAVRALVAIVLTGSLAAFGCSTNRTPGYGEPAMSAPAAGSVAPNPTSTPGSSSGALPRAMISSSRAAGESAAVDAIATLKADEAFRGKNLGPAAPGDNRQQSLSMLQPTGQQINVVPPPAGFYATTPPFFASADTAVGAVAGSAAVPAGAPATMTTAATSGAASGAFAATGGTTGLSSTTATPILTGVGPLTGALTASQGGTIAGGTTVRGATVAAGVAAPSTVTTAPVVANGTSRTAGSTTAGIRVETAPNGSVVVTNSSPTVFRRFLSSLGFRRTTTTTNQSQ